MTSEQPPSRDEPEAQLRAINGTAATWVARRDAGLDAAARVRLREWLDQDPRHAHAFMHADNTATEFDPPVHSATVSTVLAGLIQRAQRRRVRRRMVVGVASIAVAASLCFFSIAKYPRALPAHGGASGMIVRTPVRQTLPDGSIMELNDAAAYSIDFSGESRRVTLTAGAAHFEVVKSNLPFVVTAAGITARALGTSFSVELISDNVSVLVTEGRVAVNQAVGPTVAATDETKEACATAHHEPLATLVAGKSVSISTHPNRQRDIEVETIPEPVAQQRLAWRIPRLEFTITPLREVISAFNRYNRTQFVIADSALEPLPLSGVLRADRVDALVEMLEVEFDIKVVRESGQILLKK